MTRANYVMLRNCIPMADTRARWYFGELAGLLFTEDDVVPDLGTYNAGTLNTKESTLSLSDSSGNLLFYGGPYTTNAGRLYQIDSNGNHVIIVRDNGEHGNLKIKNQTAQSLLAIPHPLNPERFILFCNNAFVSAQDQPNNRAGRRG